MSLRQLSVGLLAVAVLLGLSACTSQPPTPADVAAALEASRAKERALVRETIADTQRAERFVELLGARDSLVTAQGEVVEQFRADLLALLQDYDAPPSAFDELRGEYNAERRRWQDAFIDVVARMQAATTAEEWKKISKFQLAELNPRSSIYVGRRL